MPNLQVQARLFRALDPQLSIFGSSNLPNHQLLRAAWLSQQYLDFVTHSPAAPLSASPETWKRHAEAGKAAFKTRLLKAFDFPSRNMSNADQQAFQTVLFETKIPQALGFPNKAAMDSYLKENEAALWRRIKYGNDVVEMAADLIKEHNLSSLTPQTIRDVFAQSLDHRGPKTAEALQKTFLARYEAVYAQVAEREVEAMRLPIGPSMKILYETRAIVENALFGELYEAFGAERQSTSMFIMLSNALGYGSSLEMQDDMKAIAQRLQEPFINMSAEEKEMRQQVRAHLEATANKARRMSFR